MKSTFISMLILGVLTGFSFAGEVVLLPTTISMISPEINNVEKESVTFYYGPPPFAVIEYFPVDANGRREKRQLIKLEDAVADNVESVTANCIGKRDPWELCTGVAECYNNCDESTVFTNFVTGFGGTLATRGDSAIWSDIKRKFNVLP